MEDKSLPATPAIQPGVDPQGSQLLFDCFPLPSRLEKNTNSFSLSFRLTRRTIQWPCIYSRSPLEISLIHIWTRSNSSSMSPGWTLPKSQQYSRLEPQMSSKYPKTANEIGLCLALPFTERPSLPFHSWVTGSFTWVRHHQSGWLFSSTHSSSPGFRPHFSNKTPLRRNTEVTIF